MATATTKTRAHGPGHSGPHAPRSTRRYGLHDLVTLAIGCGDPGTELHDRYQILRDALGVSTDLLRPDGGWLVRTRGVADPNGSAERGRHSALPRLAAETVAQARELWSLSVGLPTEGEDRTPREFIPVYQENYGKLIETSKRFRRERDQMLIELARLAEATVAQAEPWVADLWVSETDLIALGWPDEARDAVWRIPHTAEQA